MPLSELACRKALARPAAYKLSDAEGMYLLVTPKGAKYWRFDYRFHGKRRTLALGVYPDVGLSDARELRVDAKRRIQEGEDPATRKKEERLARQPHDFETIAREWCRNQDAKWGPKHGPRVLSRLERDVFPTLGLKSVRSIEPPEILTALRAIEGRGRIETARRVRQYVSSVFRYAIAVGKAVRDPAADIKDALKPSPRVKHLAKLRESDLPEFLSKLDAYDGDERTQLAIWLVLLTLARTNEVRFGRWSEIDWKEEVWRIPGARMKAGRDHIIPLVPKTIETLKRLKQLSHGSEWILPAPTVSGVMSENTMIYFCYRVGFHSRATVHGLRGTASTILNEQGFSSDWIETQLAHVQTGVRAAYNAARWIPQRREMLSWWQDFLEKKRHPQVPSPRI